MHYYKEKKKISPTPFFICVCNDLCDHQEKAEKRLRDLASRLAPLRAVNNLYRETIKSQCSSLVVK